MSELLLSIRANCQYSLANDSFTFGKRITDPIEMEVKEANGKISFNATNRSLFDYTLIINFSNLQNVFPMVFKREIKLHPGYNNLFDLTIKNRDQGVSYEYSITYLMRLSKNPDLTYPYLVPVGKGKTIYLNSIINSGVKTFISNQFKISNGDTVYAMRKGIVTALPENNSSVDRVFKSGSLEILHGDGTLAIYRGIKTVLNANIGHQVFPGEPIGLADEGGTLTINILSSVENLNFKNINMRYSLESGKTYPEDSINGLNISYPDDVIKKELTSKELKKFEKGKLY